MYRVFFSFLLLGFLSVCGQNVRSPCPDLFGNKQDAGDIHGIITINSFGVVTTLHVRANFTIAKRLPSTYAGSLQPIGTELYLLRDFNRGKALQYKVSFPVVSPLPRLTSITVNDKVICYGQGDVIGEVQYITTISLQHMLVYRTGTDGIYVHNPQNTPPPEMDLEFKEDPWNTNVNPFVIDNSQPAFVPPQPQTPPAAQPQTPPVVVPEYVVTTSPRTTKRPAPQPSRPVPDPLSTQVEPQSNWQCGINSITGKPIVAPLIYNGLTYDPGEWPWLVAVYRLRFGKLKYICAGTLVSPTHVVSAAHCVHRKSTYTQKKHILIRTGIYGLEDWNWPGTTAWNDDIVTRSLKEFHIHDNYNSTTLENDIVVMTLEMPVPFNSMIQPACLWSGNTVLNEIVGKSGVFAGWGTHENRSGGKGIPRMVTMPVVSTEDCRASKPDFHRLTSSTTLCAGERSGVGPCLGDSGGGLYMLHRGRWRLRGVASVALVSDEDIVCDLDQYIVFTDAAQYMPWITNVMSIT